MNDVKVELNYKGLLELWKDPHIQAACVEAAEQVRKKTGRKQHYHVSKYKGPHRAGAVVWCDKGEEAKSNNRLLRALDGTMPSGKIVRKS